MLNQNVSKLSHKTSKVRDVGDEMAQNLLDFALKEANSIKETNSSLCIFNLKQFAYCLLAVEDHRDSNVMKLLF